MAVTATLLQGSASTDDQSSYDTEVESGSQISPTANRLVLAFIQSSFGGYDPNNITPVPSITGCGLTFAAIDDVFDGASGAHRFSVHRAMSASTSTDGVVIDFGGQTQVYCIWVIVELDGVVTGNNGADAIVQFNDYSDVNATAYLLNLSTFADSGNATISGIGMPNNRDVTAGSGFTELSEVDITGTPGTVSVQFKNSADTTIDNTVNSASSGMMIGLEIAQLQSSTAKSSSDTGSGSESQSISTSTLVSSSDSFSAIGEDHSIVAGPPIGADVGTGSEAIAALTAASSGPGDVGTGIESHAIAVSMSATDAGTDAEVVSAMSAVITDIAITGGGNWDSSTVFWNASSDAWDSLPTVSVGGDYGAGSESQSVDIGLRSSSDIGASAESIALAAAVPGADVRTATVEAFSLATAGTDVGTDAEVITAQTAVLTAADTGMAAEDFSIVPSDGFTDDDFGAGTESQTSAATTSSTDVGGGSESQLIDVAGSDSGAATESVVGTGVTTADTGTAAESEIVAFISADASTTESELHTLAAAPAATDVGTTTESESFAVSTDGDTGDVQEVHALAAEYSSADDGASSESHQIHIGSPVPAGAVEAGTFTEAQSITAGVTEVDAAAGVEAALIEVSDDDTGTGSDGNESIVVTIGIFSEDEGSGSDDFSTLTVLHLAGDTSTAVELVDEMEASTSKIDVGAHLEQAVVTASISSADVGASSEDQTFTVTASDSGSAIESQAVGPTVADAAHDAEVIVSQTAVTSSNQTVITAESHVLQVSVTAADTGSGIDAAKSIGYPLSGSDTGSIVDAALSPHIAIPEIDVGQTVESFSISVFIPAADSGAFTEDAEYETPIGPFNDSGALTDAEMLEVLGFEVITVLEEEEIEATVGRSLSRPMAPFRGKHTVENMYPERVPR